MCDPSEKQQLKTVVDAPPSAAPKEIEFATSAATVEEEKANKAAAVIHNNDKMQAGEESPTSCVETKTTSVTDCGDNDVILGDDDNEDENGWGDEDWGDDIDLN